MTSSFPRALSEREQGLLAVLLEQDFPVAEELRLQAPTVRVKGLWKNLPTVVLFDVVDDAAPRAEVAHPVPVEAKVDGLDPPQEVLLFVKDGLLGSIEVVDHGDREAVELPPVEALEPPTVYRGEAD